MLHRSLRALLTLLVLSLPAGMKRGEATDWKYPQGVAQDPSGRIFLADRKFHGVLELKDHALVSVYQGLDRFRTPLNAVYCIHAARDGKLYVGDSATRDVYRVDLDGQLTSLTSGQSGAAPREEYHPGKIGIPTQIASDSQGRLFVTDLELQRVWTIPAAGGEPAEFAVLDGPRGVAVDAQDQVWILSSQRPQLRRLSADGKTSVEIVADRVFEFPQQVVVRADGMALVSDGYAKGVWKVAPGAAPEKLFSGAPFVNPVGLCLTADGNHVLVVDPRAPGLFELDFSGSVRRIYPPE